MISTDCGGGNRALPCSYYAVLKISNFSCKFASEKIIKEAK
jgi:hypothetical protein